MPDLVIRRNTFPLTAVIDTARPASGDRLTGIRQPRFKSASLINFLKNIQKIKIVTCRKTMESATTTAGVFAWGATFSCDENRDGVHRYSIVSRIPDLQSNDWAGKGLAWERSH